jgi:hypothetical protein
VSRFVSARRFLLTPAVALRIALAIALATFSSGLPLLAQSSSDLALALRSTTGSNRFQIGEAIPLEAVLSSTAANRYLEPCALFRESNFGFPECSFFSKWSFTITPADGWTDLTKEPSPYGRGVTSGGPIIPVPDTYLSPEPKSYPYLLTHTFRFGTPGEYRVRLSLEVGRVAHTDGNPNAASDGAAAPESVTVTAEVEIEIVAASAEWQKEILRKGLGAYSKPQPDYTTPPSPGYLKYQQAKDALCLVGTPEAARVLVDFLSPMHAGIESCLDHTPSPEAAIQEVERLIADPDAEINTQQFAALKTLLARVDYKAHGSFDNYQAAFDRERDALMSAVPQKRGEAQSTSLLTVLANPPRTKGTPFEFAQDQPFAPPTIALTVANYDRLPEPSQQWLLNDGWVRVRSPLMLPVLRRLADGGNGQALLRWIELDPASAREFIMKEIVQPAPRFSSYYLRLPDASLPEQEAQIAANFVALTQNQELLNSATLLHRYASKAVLPVVLPFIDARRASWPCYVEFAALDYLLKVSPADAEPRVRQALKEAGHDPCQTNAFFTDIGFLQPSPVLEQLARERIDAGADNLAIDAANYLRLHGSATAKPFVWKQLVRWHEQVAATRAANGAAKRPIDGTPPLDEYFQGTLVDTLIHTFVNGQGWLLTPEDSDRLKTLLAKKEQLEQLSCQFACGSPLSVGPGPGTYSIYSGTNQPHPPSTPDYLKPAERLHYSVNQYQCADMRTLKEKLLQFPEGSTFQFAWNFNAGDREELVEISDFLWNHGYKVRNYQNWSFLRADSRP